MDKVAADMDKALEVAQKKDDAYFNRAKLIYGYQLDKPEKNYKDWTYDRALDEVRKAIAIEAPVSYTHLIPNGTKREAICFSTSRAAPVRALVRTAACFLTLLYKVSQRVVNSPIRSS